MENKMEENIKAIMAMDVNSSITILAILGFGVFALVKFICHMKQGFGISNVRITGIGIVATMASNWLL
jgi:hypothetical protein